jgi:hypothetical protein
MLAVAEALRGILSKCSQEEKNSAPPNRDLSQDSAVTIPPFETDKAPLSDRFTTTDPAVMDARSKSPNPQGINSESSELEEDHTKIDLFSESAETIMPGQLLRNQTKQESSDTAPEEKQANRAWSNPSIELAPVGHTRNVPGQAPTLQANQVPSSSQSFGVADTLPSAPKASENTALKEQKMAVPVESGLSLRLTLFILGISIIISFGMGWFLRGL